MHCLQLSFFNVYTIMLFLRSIKNDWILKQWKLTIFQRQQNTHDSYDNDIIGGNRLARFEMHIYPTAGRSICKGYSLSHNIMMKCAGVFQMSGNFALISTSWSHSSSFRPCWPHASLFFHLPFFLILNPLQIPHSIAITLPFCSFSSPSLTRFRNSLLAARVVLKEAHSFG